FQTLPFDKKIDSFSACLQALLPFLCYHFYFLAKKTKPMKKFALIAFSAAFALLFSCNTQTGSMSESNPTQGKNITADSTIGAAFRTGDASKIDSVVASDFVDHTESGDKNRDSLKALIKMVHDNFP